MFIFLLPALQSTIFNLAIGRDPNSLRMAVVNDELNPGLGKVCNFSDACVYSMFSCRYLRALDNNTITQVRAIASSSETYIKCIIKRRRPAGAVLEFRRSQGRRDSRQGVGCDSFQSQFHRRASAAPGGRQRGDQRHHFGQPDRCHLGLVKYV